MRLIDRIFRRSLEAKYAEGYSDGKAQGRREERDFLLAWMEEKGYETPSTSDLFSFALTKSIFDQTPLLSSLRKAGKASGGKEIREEIRYRKAE